MFFDFSIMEQRVVSLSKALKLFSEKEANGMFKPFNLEYRTFNETNKKGGKLVRYKNVKYLPSAKDEDSKNNDSLKPSRPPNHFKNRTRNIELENGSIKTIRIDFIISINGLKVIY